MGEGFDYAYRYPGMNKVLQAAGRVIRTIDDVGVIELLDERFYRAITGIFSQKSGRNVWCVRLTALNHIWKILGRKTIKLERAYQYLSASGKQHGY